MCACVWAAGSQVLVVWCAPLGARVEAERQLAAASGSGAHARRVRATARLALAWLRAARAADLAACVAGGPRADASGVRAGMDGQPLAPPHLTNKGLQLFRSQARDRAQTQLGRGLHAPAFGC
jgi:hypothetical protein